MSDKKNTPLLSFDGTLNYKPGEAARVDGNYVDRQLVPIAKRDIDNYWKLTAPSGNIQMYTNQVNVLNLLEGTYISSGEPVKFCVESANVDNGDYDLDIDTGVLTYRPRPNFIGTEQIVYSVTETFSKRKTLFEITLVVDSSIGGFLTVDDTIISADNTYLLADTTMVSYNVDWSTHNKVEITSPVVNDISFGDHIAFSRNGIWLVSSSDGNAVPPRRAVQIMKRNSHYGADYLNQPSNWELNTTLYSPLETELPGFGESVSISENGYYLVVAQPSESDDSTELGYIHIYSRSCLNDVDTWTHDATFSDNGWFGREVRINQDGDYVVVAARNDLSNGNANLGSVYIYNKDESGVWSLQEKIANPDGMALGYPAFGQSISITETGSKLAVSSIPRLESSPVYGNGVTYVFNRVGATWSLEQTILVAQDAPRVGFTGTQVEFSGDGSFLVINAPDDASLNPISYDAAHGSLFVYKFYAGSYVFDSKLIHDEYAENVSEPGVLSDRFGSSFYLDHDGSWLVSAVREDAGPNSERNFGSVKLFKRQRETWEQVDTFYDTDGAAYDLYPDGNIWMTKDGGAFVTSNNRTNEIHIHEANYLFIDYANMERIRLMNSDTSGVLYLTLNEGDEFFVHVEANNWQPATLWWKLESATISDFTATSGIVQTSGDFEYSTGSFPLQPIADLTTEEDQTYTLTLKKDVNGALESVDSLTLTLIDSSTTPIDIKFLDELGVTIITELTLSEGSSVVVNMLGQSTPVGTYYWTLDDATTADFQSIDGQFELSGSFATSTGSFSIETIADSLTELGGETRQLSIRATSKTSPVVAFLPITVDDTSYGAESILITNGAGSNLTTISIGEGVTDSSIFVETQNWNSVNFEADSLYWTLEGSADSDFLAISGTVSLTGDFANAFGVITLQTIEDALTEYTGPNRGETFTLNLRKTSTVGPIIDSVEVNVLDTSYGPETISFVNASESITEGGSTTVNVSIENKELESLYWTIESATGIFESVSGSFTPTGNFGSSTASFGLASVFDTISQDETYTINLRKDGILGDIVASTTILVVNVSVAYNIAFDVATVTEANELVTLTLNTVNVPDASTVDYTITGVTVDDISLSSLTGTLTVLSSAATLSFNVLTDRITEGEETLVLTLADTDSDGFGTGSPSVSVVIQDTSLTPSYDSIAFDVSSIEENNSDTATLTINTSNVDDGTTVGYTITGVTAGDINLSSLSNDLSITSNTATLSILATADNDTDGDKTLVITLDATDSTGSPTGSLSSSVNIIDTSLTPEIGEDGQETSSLSLTRYVPESVVSSAISPLTGALNTVFAPSFTILRYGVEYNKQQSTVPLTGAGIAKYSTLQLDKYTPESSSNSTTVPITGGIGINGASLTLTRN